VKEKWRFLGGEVISYMVVAMWDNRRDFSFDVFGYIVND